MVELKSVIKLKPISVVGKPRPWQKIAGKFRRSTDNPRELVILAHRTTPVEDCIQEVPCGKV